MATLADECRLSFYEEIAPLKENQQFWLVRHIQTGRYYVKKNLSCAHREVYEALKEVNSPNLPKIYECILNENEFVVIEEFINGDGLANLTERGKITTEYAIKIMMDICNVLFTLHSMRPPVIHRDIKPENIMISDDGIVKLMDFDIARVYDREKKRDTEYMGTVGYASPEHFGFGQTDARSDIYSCGILLNYLLTGQFPEEKLAEGQYGFIVNKCTQINPIQRYQNIFQLRQALIETAYQNSATQGNTLENQLYQNNQRGVEKAQVKPVYARKWQKFLPPGFRTLKVWKMGIALLFYCVFIDCALTLKVENAKSVGEIVLNRVFCGIGLFSSVLVLFNYLGIADQLPGSNRSNGRINWGMRCLYALFTLILVICVLCVVVEIYNNYI